MPTNKYDFVATILHTARRTRSHQQSEAPVKGRPTSTSSIFTPVATGLEKEAEIINKVAHIDTLLLVKAHVEQHFCQH